MSTLSVSQSDKISGQHEKASFLSSQSLLFQSRKKWGLIYALATVAGLFCVPGGIIATALENEPVTFLLRTLPLPFISFLVIVGMYVLNDLIDADLDRANGKNRPIPTGRVSKRQAWAFVMATNGVGILLAGLTLNPLTAVIALAVVVIGLMYSMPKTSLKDRFVVKTLSIAFALVLCALAGATSFGSSSDLGTLMMPVYIALILGSMVFITSPFNDLGDVAGDKAAGRRTIPIVIGPQNTVKMAISLAAGMIALSGVTYSLSAISLTMAFAVSVVGAITIMNMSKTINRLDNTEFVRKQHKKSLPLHIMLQAAIIIGTVLVQ